MQVDGRFDAVLIMGPLYDLVEAEDRIEALDNARDWLVDCGLVFSAWISRYGMLGDVVKSLPDWIDREGEVASIMADGRDPPGPRAGSRGYLQALTGFRRSMDGQASRRWRWPVWNL